MQRIFVVPPSSYPLNNTMQSLQLNSNRPNGCLSLTDQDTEHHGFPARKSNAGADCKVRAWQSMIQMRAAGAGVGRAAAPASARADPPQTRPQQLRPRARAPERARPAAPGAPSRAAKAELSTIWLVVSFRAALPITLRLESVKGSVHSPAEARVQKSPPSIT